MKNRDLERAVNKAFSAATPDILEKIQSDCRTDQRKVTTMTTMHTKKKTRWVSGLAAAAAALALVLGGFAGIDLYKGNQVDATVALEVNPSLEITVNHKEQVLEVTPKNEDAVTVIGDMDFKGTDLDITVNALVGSMLRNGYINEIANSILITVDGKSEKKAQALEAKLATEIGDAMKSDGLEGAVLSQTAKQEDQGLKSLAQQYGITTGKAQLIQAIVASEPNFREEQLAKLSINQLGLLLSNSQIAPEGVQQAGQSSAQAYIGEEKALEIALNKANLTEGQLTRRKIKLDFDDGKARYELDLYTADAEYEIDIDAATGALIEIDKEPLEQKPTTPAAPAKTAREAAIAIALQKAGLTESQVTALKAEYDDGRWEVEFKQDGFEYDAEIDAATGAVLKFEKEKDDDVIKPEPKPETPAGREAAIAAALQKAGLAQSAVTALKAEWDRDGHWDIEFRHEGYEYDAEVKADGTVLKFEKDRDEDYRPATDPVTPAGKDAAIAAALERAGLSQSQVRELEAELDEGRWDVEFKADGYEYDVEVSADGTILKFEKERD